MGSGLLRRALVPCVALAVISSASIAQTAAPAQAAPGAAPAANVTPQAACAAPSTAISGAYTVATFSATGNCTWSPPGSPTATVPFRTRYLVVGGGGGGRGGYVRPGGGGGGGAVKEGSATSATSPLTIVVGSGGAEVAAGGASSVLGVTANGGSAATGGALEVSNGGASGTPMSGGTGSTGGGGGGGASAAGGGPYGSPLVNGGAGGAGTASTLTGASVTYGGGGGGGCMYSYPAGQWSGVGGAGGSGGGGAGGCGNGAAGTNGRGGGGGGGGNASSGSQKQSLGGAGGSGVVILKYIAPPVTTVSPGLAAASLAFTAVGDGTGVSKYQYTVNGGTSWVDLAASARTVTVPNVKNGQTYTFGVRAVATNGDIGNASSATTTLPGPQAKVVATTTGPLTAGQRIAVTITRQDAAGVPTTVRGEDDTQSTPLTVDLAPITGDDTYYDAATGGNVITTATIPAGASSTTVYFSSTLAGTKTLTPTADGLTSVTASLVVKPSPTVSLALSTVTAAMSPITANGTAVSVITVRPYDIYGNAFITGPGTVTVATTRGTMSAVANPNTGAYTATLTAGTVAGTATVSAAYNGAAIAQTATVDLVAGPAAKLTVSPIAQQTAGSPFSVTVTLDDTFGNDVVNSGADGTVTLTRGAGTGTIGGTLVGTIPVGESSVTIDGATYTKAETGVKVVATGSGMGSAVNGKTGTSSAFTVVPGPAVATMSTVTASPASITANGTSTATITVQAKDPNGNNVTVGGATVTLATTRGSLGTVTDNRNGTYTATLMSSTSAGSATVSATLDGSPVTQTAAVTMVAGAPSKLVVSPIGTQAAGVPFGVTVTLTDAYGNPASNTGSAGNVALSLTTGTGTAGKLTGTLAGTIPLNQTSVTIAGVTYTKAESGIQLTATGTGAGSAVNAKSGTSAAFTTVPGAVSAAQSTLTAAPTSITADGTSTTTLTVQAKDAQGNNLTSGGATVALTHASGAGSLGPVTDNGDGTYSATLTSPTTAGTPTFTATIDGNAVKGGGASQTTVSVTYVAGAPAKLVVSPIGTPVAGTPFPVTVTLTDVNGNPANNTGSTTVTLSRAAGTGALGGTSSGTIGVGASSVTITGVTYPKAESGVQIRATGAGGDGDGKSATSPAFTVTPGAVAAASSTFTGSPLTIVANGVSTTTLTVRARDALGNNQVTGGATVVYARASDDSVLGAMTDNGDGTYTVTLTSPTAAGTASFHARINGALVGGNVSPAQVTITYAAGAATAASSTLAASPARITANGTSTTTLTVQAKDSFGNNLITGGATVVISKTTGAGTLGPVVDNGDGTYTATLTSPRTSGSATFTATLGGQAVGGGPVTVTYAADVPHDLTVQSGANQDDTAGGPVTAPILVLVADQLGNPVPDDTVTFSVRTGGGSLSVTTALTNASGLATLPGGSWTLGTSAVTQTLLASAGTPTPATVVISAQAHAGAVTRFEVTRAGGSTPLTDDTLTAGSRTLIRVAADDTYGNPVTTWTGPVTLTSTAFSGSATVTITSRGYVDDSIIATIAGTGRTITAAAAGVTAAVAVPSFAVVPGALAGFTVTDDNGNPLGSVTAGVPVWVRLTAVDLYGNTIPGWTGPVSLSSPAFPSPVTATIVTGGTVRTQLTPTTGGPDGRITVTGGGVSSTTTGGFAVQPAAPARLSIVTQPVAGANDDSLTVRPVIRIDDAYGNQVTTATDTVTATAANGTLLGGTQAQATGGIATFATLGISGEVGVDDTITFSSGSLAAVVSQPVRITGAGSVRRLSLRVASPATSPAGAVFATVPRVAVTDSGGRNIATDDDTTVITAAISAPASLGAAERLIGTTSVRVANGVARFVDLGISGTAGTTYMITFSASGLGTVDDTVQVTTGAAATLSLVTQPRATLPYGAVVSDDTGSPLQVQVVDAGGNVVTTYDDTLIGAKDGSPEAYLSGSTARAVNGIATFTNLRLYGLIGDSYHLTFAARGVASVTSSAIALAKGDQSISFPTPSGGALADPGQQLTATASSGLPVTFSLPAGVTDDTCSVTPSGLVRYRGLGTCTIGAYQAGDDTWLAATPALQSFTIIASPPAAPVIAHVTGSDQAITVDYSAPSFTGGMPITGYTAKVHHVDQADDSTLWCGAVLTCTIPGLTNDDSYIVQVAAVTSAGTGPYDSSRPVSPNAGALGVTGLSTSVVDDTTVALSWAAPTPPSGSIDHYDIYVRSIGGAYVLAGTVLAPGTTYAVDGLTPGVPYDFKVVTVVDDNGTTLTGYREIQETPARPPSAPVGLRATYVGDDSVTLSWGPPASDGGAALDDTYVVRITGPSLDATSVCGTQADRTCTFPSLTPGAAYSFSVRASNRIGLGTVATVAYAAPSADATLSHLTVSSGGTQLADDTSATVSLAVSYLKQTVQVSPVSVDDSATITVNGQVVASGGSVTLGLLPGGDTPIKVMVIPANGIRALAQVHRITISRAGPPTQLAATPRTIGGFASGSTLATIAVEIQDATGNRSTDAVPLVSVRSSSGVLTGDTEVTAVGGMATFANLTFAGRVGQAATLTFSTPGLADDSVVVTPAMAGPPVRMEWITKPPVALVAGEDWVPAPQLRVLDDAGNPVTDDSTTRIRLTLPGVSLLGDTEVTVVHGVATFPHVRVGTIVTGSDGGVVASSTPALSAPASASVTYAPGAPGQLLIARGGSGALEAGADDSVTVTIVDDVGNVVMSDDSGITLAAVGGTGDDTGSVAGLGTLTPTRGVATFAISGNRVGHVALRASIGAGLITAALPTFDVVAGPAAGLEMTVSGADLPAGLDRAVRVRMVDVKGNTVPSTSTVTVTATGAGTVTGLDPITLVGGVGDDTFTARTPGAITLRAATAVPVLVSAPSTLTVVAGVPTSVVLTGVDGTLAAGDDTTITATVRDSIGNVVTSPRYPVVFAMTQPDDSVVAQGQTLPVTVLSTDGVATLRVTGKHVGAVALRASIDDTRTPAFHAASNIGTLMIVPGAAASIAVTDDTSDLVAGNARTLIATVTDAMGNPVSTDDTITFRQAGGAGSVLGLTQVCAGKPCQDVRSTRGVASITVSGDQAGSVALQAAVTSGSTTYTASTAFTVVTGPASHLDLTASSSGPLTSGMTRTYAATLKDSRDNTVTSPPRRVTFAKLSGTGNFVGDDSVMTSGGVATVTLTGMQAGTMTLRASATVGGTTLTDDTGLQVVPAAPSKLLLAATPLAGANGAPLTRQPVVEVVDAQGNPVAVDDTITASSGALSLSGTTAVPVIGGVATFTDLALTGTVGVDDTLTFTTTTGLRVHSAPLAITAAGPVTTLRFDTRPPSSSDSGEAFATAPRLSLVDASGNVAVTDDTSVLTVAITSPGSLGASEHLVGSVSRTVSDGVATFTGLGLSGIAGTAYTLTFSSGSLPAQTATVTLAPGAPASVVLAGGNDAIVAGDDTTLVATVYDSAGNVATTLDDSLVFTVSPADDSVVSLGRHLPVEVHLTSGAASLPITALRTGPVSLRASLGALPSNSRILTIAPGGPAQISLTATGATSDLGAGTSRTYTARVTDAQGNAIATDDTITFRQAGGTGAVSGLTADCSGSPCQEVRSTRGIASVTLTGDRVGSVSLSAVVTVGSGALTSPLVRFTVVVGPIASIDIGQAATGPLASGTTRTFTATIKDPRGNVITAPQNQVLVLLSKVADSGSGTVVMDDTAVTQSGIASFAVTGRRSGLLSLRVWTSASLNSFHDDTGVEVIPGAPASMVITQQPAGMGDRVPLATQPVLRLRDAAGNDVPTAGSVVTAELLDTSGFVVAGAVSDDTAATDSSGIAAFTHLTTDADPGTYRLRFTSPGLPAVTSQQVTLAKLAQTLAIVPSIPGRTLGDAAFALDDTTAAASSGLPVTLTSATGRVCSVSATRPWVVNILGAGTCTLQASQSGNVRYNAASPVSGATFAVLKAAQAPLNIAVDDSAVTGLALPVTVTGGSGTGRVTVSVTAGDCSYDDTRGTVTGQSAGACTLQAGRAGDGNYLAATAASRTLQVAKAAQTISFSSAKPLLPVPDGTYEPTARAISAATGRTSGLSVGIQASGHCTMSQGTVTFTDTGTCTLTASQPGNADFLAAADVVQVIEVGSLNQSIAFAQPGNSIMGESTHVALSATSSAGLPVSFSGTTPGVCTVDDSTGVATINAVGDCSVTASANGDSRYAAASPVTRTFTVLAGPATQPYITSVSPGDGAITVGFTTPGFSGGTPITAYRIVAVSADGDDTVVTSACLPSTVPLACTIHGLDNTKAYRVSVTAITSAGPGDPSPLTPVAPAEPLEPGPTPHAVGDLVAVADDTVVTVHWTPLTPAQQGDDTFIGYVVQYFDGVSWVGDDSVTSVTADFITIAVPDGEHVYPIRLVALTHDHPVVDDNYLDNIAVVKSIPPVKPTTPRQVTFTPLAPGDRASVTWSPPASDGGSPVLEYRIEIMMSDGSAPQNCTVTATTIPLACEFADLQRGAGYDVRVVAVNRIGDSTAEPITPTQPTPPARPRNVSAVAREVSGTTGFTVTWGNPSSDGGASITGYTATAVLRSAVEDDTSASASLARMTPRASDDTTFTCSSNATTCFMPASGTIYDYVFTVAAGNLAGVGPRSTPFAPVAPPTPPAPGSPPGPPTKVVAVPGPGSLVVSWKAPGEAGSFPITQYRATAQPGGRICLATAPTLTCTIDGLDDSTVYTVTVAALNGSGWSEDSTPSDPATPLPVSRPTRPGRPLQVAAVSRASGVVTVRWQPPASVGSSAITRYIVGYRAVGQFRYITVKVGPDARSWTIKGLTPGRKYGIRVRAANVVGPGKGVMVMVRVRR